MPSATNPDMERTKKRIIADYKKGKKPKELADKYGISVNTVKSWIKRDAAQPKEGAKKRVQEGAKKQPEGAPVGNTNAVGHKGAGGPPNGNVNAFKHGGYSPVFWDTLTEEEQNLLMADQADEEQMLVDEIHLLTIRERRIMQAIRKHLESEKGLAVAAIIKSEERRVFDDPEDQELYEDIIARKIAAGERLPGRNVSVTTRTEATYDVIGRLEEALTRVQAQKQRCIQALSDIRMKRDGEDVEADTVKIVVDIPRVRPEVKTDASE